MTSALRVVVADDSGIFRQGLVLLLQAAGVEVLASCVDSPTLLHAVDTHRPDACVVDVRMPPTHTDEGIVAARTIKATYPGIGVLALSTYAEPEWAERLLAEGPLGVGYLLKDRVNDGAELVESIARIAVGGTAVDPEVVSVLIRRRSGTQLDSLTDRERDVLAQMAQGRSNLGISQALFLSPRTVEFYVASIFAKLGLHHDVGDAHNRRVLAVLTFLRHAPR